VNWIESKVHQIELVFPEVPNFSPNNEIGRLREQAKPNKPVHVLQLNFIHY